MSALPLNQAIENIYTSLEENNQGLDLHIAELKKSLAAEGKKEAIFTPARLAQNNRQGRKLMQSYFKKRGVVVTFAEGE